MPDVTLPPGLQAAVAEAYRVFAGSPIGPKLSVCRCPVCMTDATEAQLVRTPLREISADLLAEYTNSAHGWDDADIAREMRYFLPRYLDLIALGDAPCHLGQNVCLRRLYASGWRETWPEAERHVLQVFFDELVTATAQRLIVTPTTHGPEFYSEMRDILSMIATAGGDVDRALDVLEKCPDPAAAAHIAALRQLMTYRKGESHYRDSALSDLPLAQQAIRDFLLRSDLTERIEAAFFLTDNPALQTILSRAV